ncbi:uncharacterized protein LOC115677168 isoform X2 [Syzygium oleosum]|uniref:uncharacterized protein LOC115677168 isoform X2 n=1 Tax=Syzygium oleosum TaxID=219896 RepID=UPI0024BA3A46|nr:uncharacterized protein LOC115677168 isoform X2 [Syzygium oleosum]
MERSAWPRNLSSSRKRAIKELLHGQNPTKKLRHLFDAHSQPGNNTRQPLFAEVLVVNGLGSFSNTLSESMSAESDEVMQVPTNACVWSEVSDEESINTPFRRSFGDDRKMEDPELEEGEAYSYHDNDHGFDDGIDPDVSLYIEEKLQEVLGHFRDDFKRGVTAENLGAKFSGYGSFLPAYERFPPRGFAP